MVNECSGQATTRVHCLTVLDARNVAPPCRRKIRNVDNSTRVVVALLALAAILVGMAAVSAGCDGAAEGERGTATPTSIFAVFTEIAGRPPGATLTPTSIWEDVTRSAEKTAHTTPAPTATPRPSKVVVEPEPSFTPAAEARRTLVVLSGTTSLAVDTDTGAVDTLVTAPPYDHYYNPYTFSPDGLSYAFACADDGTNPRGGYHNSLCVGGLVYDYTRPPDDTHRFGDYTPHQFEWSPDSRYLLFRQRTSRGEDRSYPDIFMLDLHTGATRLVIKNSGHSRWQPAVWSPEGSRFAIQRDFSEYGGPSNLHIVDAATGAVKDIASGFDERIRISPPAWSPEGGRLAFVGQTGTPDINDPAPEYGLYVVAVDGAGLRKIMQGTLGPPHWSPDGIWIATTVTEEASGPSVGNAGIYAVRADGPEERALPDEVFWSANPVWAPDSSHLAFVGGVSFSRSTSISSIRGAPPVEVSDGDLIRPPSFLVFSPDGKRIFFTLGGSCGKGGCTEGTLHTEDLVTGEARRLDDRPITRDLGWAP